MAISATDRAFLRTLYGRLKDEPLPPDSPYYEPVHERLKLEDPVKKIETLIEFDGIESIRLFSGFRGSGKTTELNRLQKVLQDRGYFVLYADALNYVNQAEPIDITDLLMVLAGAFSDALEAQLGGDLKEESFWEQIWRFLQTEIKPTGGSASGELETPAKKILGGAKVSADIKFEIKAGTSFRKELRDFMTVRLRDLKGRVDKFFEDGVKRIQKHRGADTQIVFIFDQLEQLRGTIQAEADVIRSVERIFAIHLDLLHMPYVHAVFTVPPWLKFVLPGAVQITLLSTAHLWNNDEERSPCKKTWPVFHSLVERRLGKDGLERLFGAGKAQKAAVDTLIGVCGGHYRDLLGLLRNVVARGVTEDSLPVPLSLVKEVVAAARRDFMPIAADDAAWLVKIATQRASALPSTDPGPVTRLARFLDSHSVLYSVHLRIRNSLGFRTRKLSLTASRKVSHWAGTVSRRKVRTSLWNARAELAQRLWVRCLCISPHSRSIGLRCGQ